MYKDREYKHEVSILIDDRDFYDCIKAEEEKTAKIKFDVSYEGHKVRIKMKSKDLIGLKALFTNMIKMIDIYRKVDHIGNIGVRNIR